MLFRYYFPIFLISLGTSSGVTGAGDAAAALDYKEYGTQQGLGNLVGVSPDFLGIDYSTRELFQKKVDQALEEARLKGALTDQSVVVFPELVGMWSIFEGTSKEIYDAPNEMQALQTLGMQSTAELMTLMTFGHSTGGFKEKAIEALYRLHSTRLLQTYHSVFSEAARKFGVTVIAGSTVLPALVLDRGELKFEKTHRLSSSGKEIGLGPLYNTSVVYRPDGSPYEEQTRKVYLVSTERAFLAPGTVSSLPVYDTPIGRVGVLICADAWHPEMYFQLQAKGAQYIAVPAMGTGTDTEVWSKPWGGNRPGVPALTEEQAWLLFTTPMMTPYIGAKQALTVFGRGTVVGRLPYGKHIAVDKSLATHLGDVASSQGEIINLWLE